MDTNVRPESMERITTRELADKFIEEQITAVREQVGDKKVLFSGTPCQIGALKTFLKTRLI